MIRAALQALAAIVVLAAAAPGQDLLQLKDGRFVQAEGVRMTRTPQGVTVHFKSGDVFVRSDLVREAAVSKTEGMPEERPPADAAEKDAQGFVRFEGKWLKKEQRDKLVDDRHAARMRRIQEARDHRDWRNRYKTQTANFEFEYTIDPEELNALAPLIEAYYKTFLAEWRITKPPKLGRAKICFYHDRDTYLQVSGSPVVWAGYFQPRGSGELNFYFDRNDRELTTLVMLHETNHYLTYLIDPEFRYPIWINESLAEYYGASKWNPATKTMTVGGLQEGRIAAIQDQILAGKWQGLDALMRTPQASFTADCYAWGWSFVHFLLENKRYAQKFKTFYVSLARDKAVKTTKIAIGPTALRTVEPDEVIRVLLQHLGVKDLDTLEKEWHESVKALQPTSARGYAEAASLYAGLDMPIKAKRFFQTAIDKGDQRPVVYHGLGDVLARRNEHGPAEAAFKQAIEGDPLNGPYYVALSRAIAQRTGNRNDDESVRLRRLAVEVDPDNPELIRMLWIEDALRDAFGGPTSR